LLKQDYGLEVFNLSEFAAQKNTLKRLKGRIIGTSGKTRQVIEELTGAYISVYGKTISVIGEMQALSYARTAIDMLIRGSPHRNVYQWLEKQRRVQRKIDL